MKFYGIIFLFLPLISSAADFVQCKVSGASDGLYKPFEAGSFTLNLENGNSWLVSKDGIVRMDTVGSETLSSIQMKRSSCDLKVTQERDEFNQVRSMSFSFDYCKDTSKSARYISVYQSFHLSENRGYYEELVFDGESDSPFFVFKNCKLVSEVR